MTAIDPEAKTEIRNLIVRANCALHLGRVAELRETVNRARERVNALPLTDGDAQVMLAFPEENDPLPEPEQANLLDGAA